MKRVLAAFLAFLPAACGGGPEKERERDRQKSEEEIRAMSEEVLVAMRENRPEVYWNHLCERDRNARPLAQLRDDWNADREFLRDRASGVTVYKVVFENQDPNLANVWITGPNVPEGFRAFDAVRFEGIWKIREATKPIAPPK
jgi:hypothetical protein